MGLRRSFKPTNLVVNGDFSKGIANWSAGKGSIAAANNILTLTASGASYNFAWIHQADIPFIVGNKYYSRFIASPKTTDITNITLWADNVDVISQAPTQKDALYSISGIFTYTGALAQIRAYMSAVTKESIAGDTIEIQKFFCCDLTKDGVPADILALSNNNLKAWCDLNIPVWFDGTLSCGVMNGKGGLR